MIIEPIKDQIIGTLNLGCFPRRVLEFQDSQDFFEQLVFVDYQLQLLIQNEFDGTQLVPTEIYHQQPNDSCKEKLTQLIGYAESVTSNYNDINKEYQDKLYCSIILGHIYYLNSQFDLMYEVLNSVTVNNNYYNSGKLTHNQNGFLNYLICRYNVLLGLLDSSSSHVNPVNDSYKLWIEYLCYKEKPFYKTDVAGNYWLDILFKYLSLKISGNGEHQLSFADVLGLKFKDNSISLLRFCNFLVNFKNEINVHKIIDGNFKVEYSHYLNSLILEDLKNDRTKAFPDANDSSEVIEDFITNFYTSVGKKHKQLINLKTSKKYLITLTERTYQSQAVLVQLIKILIELNEYDEALAAFKTFINYVEKDEEINKGQIHDILNIIDLFSTCLIKFNPLHSIKNDRFKYTTDKQLVVQLLKFSDKLTGYLNILKKDCNFNYDEDEEFRKFESNHLSFLYNKYNINILLDDRSDFLSLISGSWYSIGYLYYYLLIYKTPTYELSVRYQNKLLTAYKNSLIINSTGNLSLLFNYALILSYTNNQQLAAKLCKFILKKYPESFKTWNLLALITSTTNLKESDKFINNGLNIAGIYIIKCKNDEMDIPTPIKKDILQLKYTQLSIWEQMFGVNYLLENLSEVFILYYELFNIKYEEQIKDGNKNYLIDSKWSHRPSFIDPKSNKDLVINNTKKQNAKNNIKNISKINNTKEEPKTITKVTITEEAKQILQDIWLWSSKIYFKIGMYEESELCIIEGENIYKPNIKTYIALGYLTSKQTKFLSLQEFEKSLEKLEEFNEFNRVQYLENVLGLCKLFLIDDTTESSLFISAKDLTGGLIRLKNYLESFLNSWPIGFNCVEVWYYLSLIYEKFDDKILLNKCLKRCIELENSRPVRNFYHCDDNFA